MFKVPRFKKSPPFAHTRASLVRLNYIKYDNNITGKSYVLFCSCILTRDVHLELIADPLPYEFMAVSKRFLNRFF